jgi:hypothetical protein
LIVPLLPILVPMLMARADAINLSHAFVLAAVGHFCVMAAIGLTLRPDKNAYVAAVRDEAAEVGAEVKKQFWKRTLRGVMADDLDRVEVDTFNACVIRVRNYVNGMSYPREFLANREAGYEVAYVIIADRARHATIIVNEREIDINSKNGFESKKQIGTHIVDKLLETTWIKVPSKSQLARET